MFPTSLRAPPIRAISPCARQQQHHRVVDARIAVDDDASSVHARTLDRCAPIDAAPQRAYFRRSDNPSGR